MNRILPTALATSLLPLLALAGSPSAACAGELELAGYVGLSAPTYSQTFSYRLGELPSYPGVGIDQRGTFDLTATGGTAFGGGLTWFPSGVIGVEARMDTADMTLETRNATFDVAVDLPAPFNRVSTTVDLSPALVDLERPRPFSLNLRLRTPGSVRFSLSGGVSYLPSLNVRVVQPLAVSAPVLSLIGGQLDIGEVPIRAEADPTVEGSRWGGNLGLGLQIPLGETVALSVEARGFYFGTHRLTWRRADERPLNPVEEGLVQAVLPALPPIEFEPIFFNATAGLAFSF